MPDQPIHSLHTDDLSPFAQQILQLDLPTAYTQLVVHTPGNPAAREKLTGATPEIMLSSPVRNKDAARAMLAGLWLWHDHLDESHTISQALHDETGSFWHAIMHRREGDFSNSKYWYARCASHPVFQTLAPSASAIINPLPSDKRLLRLTLSGWDPRAFVDLIESLHRTPTDPLHPTAVTLQQLEWRLLFDHSTRSAT